jgi:hypothetical protein
MTDKPACGPPYKAGAMKVIYIAGPFRAPNSWEIEQNIRRAEAAALEVWRLGAVALCPHTNTRFFQGAAPDEVWLAGGLELVRRSDAIYVIGGAMGIRASAGTRAEIDEADRLRLPVFMSLRPLALWLLPHDRRAPG